jgi:hypothetical protein
MRYRAKGDSIMPNSIRSLALAAVLSLAVVPTLSAENTGTDPKPTAAAQFSMLEQLQYNIIFFFSLYSALN